MSEREGGRVRVRNGMLVVEGEQNNDSLLLLRPRNVARLDYRERMVTVCVSTV